MKIVIIGAGEVGFHVAKSLSELDYDISVIDIDHKKCSRANEHLDVIVNQGNGSDEKLLKNINVADADYVFCLTNSDETNLISSLQCHNLGAKKIIARLRDLDYSRNGNAIPPEKFGVDMVIHLAAYKSAGESMKNPLKYTKNNIDGSISLLRSMVEHNVKNIIFSSTAAVYGLPEYLPLDEKHPLKPINHYGYTKLQTEKTIDLYGKEEQIRYINLRYFNAAGYDATGRINSMEKNPANLIPSVMEVASGKRNKLLIYGNDFETIDGTGVRDYIHAVSYTHLTLPTILLV